MVKLFDLVAGRDRLYRLEYSNRWMIPAEISCDEENAIFQFDIENLKSVLSLKTAPLLDRLRLLTNIAGLFEVFEEFAFSLSPDNLYVDLNLQPQIVMRDLTEEQCDEDDFTKQYRALAGALLAPRYNYDDYLHSGNGLYKKKSNLNKLPILKTTHELSEFFEEQYAHQLEKQQRTKTFVNRKRHQALLVLMPLFALLFIVSGTASWYLYTQVLPFQQTLLSASHLFVREDYDGAIDSLKDINPSAIPKEERFQLARAYVISESLSPQQKRNILSGLTLQTDDSLLLFWIQLGRVEYESAIDTAQRIGDDELLLYALVKYQVAVQSNKNITGEEKVNLTSSIDQQIEALRKKQENKEKVLDETKSASTEQPKSKAEETDSVKDNQVGEITANTEVEEGYR